MKEIVPEITDLLRQRLANHGFGEPEMVAVEPDDDCTVGECWKNVPILIEESGGTVTSGFIVWQQVDELWLHLEAHAVWQRPDGTIIDPTPKADRESEIVFVRHPLTWKGCLIPSKWLVLSSNPDVIRFCELLQRRNEELALIPSGESRPMTTSQQRDNAEQSRLTMKLFTKDVERMLETSGIGRMLGMSGGPTKRENERVGRNDPCPCGSGRKFKKCCAKR